MKKIFHFSAFPLLFVLIYTAVFFAAQASAASLDVPASLRIGMPMSDAVAELKKLAGGQKVNEDGYGAFYFGASAADQDGLIKIGADRSGNLGQIMLSATWLGKKLITPAEFVDWTGKQGFEAPRCEFVIEKCAMHTALKPEEGISAQLRVRDGDEGGSRILIQKY